MKPRLSVLTACLLAGAAFPATAQVRTDDWDLRREPARTTAAVEFESGLGILVRCEGRTYQAVIVGLPTAEGPTRPLRIGYGDAPLVEETWNAGASPEMAVSDFPAPFARKLREGGRLQIVAPGAGSGGRNLRHDVTLPASSAAVDATLEACGRPLRDPLDVELGRITAGGLPARMGWRRQPEPRFPRGSLINSGWATVSCIAQADGYLRNCIVETEYPAGGGFGEEAVRAAERASLANLDQPTARMLPSRVGFRVNFQR